MDMKKWLEEMKSPGTKKPMPILSFPCISLMGITVRQLISDSEIQAKGMKLVADTVESSASVSMMDLSVEAEVFGSEICVSDTEVPTVIGSLVTDLDAARALRIPEVGEGRTGLYVEAISKVSRMVTDRPVFAGVIGPYSLTGRLMGVTEAMVNCYTEPDMVREVMDKAAEFIIKYINAYKAAGADGVVMAEPLTGMLSPDLAAEFSEPWVKRIADAVKSDDFVFIFHNCGNNIAVMIDSILRIGADAYHFGDAIDMRDILPQVPSDVLVMGNISPSLEFLNGTPESITESTLSLMRDLCPKYPNFLISSGCDIPPASSWENIKAFFAAAASYYA